MKDFVSKGQGNSRFLKSSLAVGTSWEDALAALRTGTFPIDFNGVNADGYTQLGTALNKANLLDDTTAAALALGEDPTVNDALAAIAAGWMRREIAYYAGTGQYGESNPNTLTFSFAPSVVLFIGEWLDSSDYQGNSAPGETALVSLWTTSYVRRGAFGANSSLGKVSNEGKTISWYGSTLANQGLNTSGRTYYFLALA